jgi:hypothetical protein
VATGFIRDHVTDLTPTLRTVARALDLRLHHATHAGPRDRRATVQRSTEGSAMAHLARHPVNWGGGIETELSNRFGFRRDLCYCNGDALVHDRWRPSCSRCSPPATR